ncbi:hypothetical protein HYPBUDRAFT_111719 [Hyphopichia burtonii NRRL Y-1933]|uniref:Altered inheritance of mitochondria protein 24, mitochondrial n=1 Tax=Hyphopichia burtonii NRRL Y-1933 TaxID=984485 RepID=A0A1E4RHK1_9ASCO|nr:hypothetical protein HYPBUDRAFT_111719 [Hyphopichia burtonii NRRL Y-1933]ODV66585.1 hypothetical protein HYPBUDRAFT_111719 [Hyphopichia burtonii NRRL Y-1933]
MKPVRQLNFIRKVSVGASPSSSVPSPTQASAKVDHSVSDPKNIKYADNLAVKQNLELAEFQALGIPPTIMSVQSPPSVPVYIRRGSLLSVYGVDSANNKAPIQHQLEIINPIKRFIYGNYASSYLKLISTTPFSMLVSSISRNFSIFTKSNNKSFVSLNLDGINDWAILDNQALQVYTGNSLKVGMYKLPYYILKALSKKYEIPSNSLTGLYKWNSLGYTLLSGRGQVGLVGNGTIYNVNLRPEEEILINQNNLLGISVNGPYDLQNCILKYSFPINNENDSDLQKQIETTSIKLTKKEVDSSTMGTYGYYFNLIKDGLQSLITSFKKIRSVLLTYFVGNQEFIKIVGPRNLLLQSNSPNQYKLDNNNISYSTIPLSSKSDKHVHQQIENKTASDYLNYVKVDKSGTNFKSTPDFKETIEKKV